MVLGDKTHYTMKQMTEDYLMTNAPAMWEADVKYPVIKGKKIHRTLYYLRMTFTTCFIYLQIHLC